MHYICTANEGVKFILKRDLYCGSPLTAFFIYIFEVYCVIPKICSMLL